jgi:hypothetical protein
MINMPDGKLEPESCDHVFEAEYCIKSTSLDSNLSSYSLSITNFLLFLHFNLLTF